MSEAFDPYFKWLGIPKGDQPPHNYRLLGIEPFETDVDVISNAVDARMAQLKSYQSSKYGAISQKLLNQMAAAKVCLLDPNKKAAYDAQLRQRLVRAKSVVTGVGITADLANELASSSAFDIAGGSGTNRTSSVGMQKRSSQKGKPWPLYAAAGATVALLAGAGLYLSLPSGAAQNQGNVAVDDRAPLIDSRHAKDAPAVGKEPVAQTATAPEAKPTVKPQPKPTDSVGPPAVVQAAESKKTPRSDLADFPVIDSPGSKPSSPETLLATTNDSKQVAMADAPAAGKHDDGKPGAVPDKSQQQATEVKIKDIFQQEFAAAKSTHGRTALIKKLIEEADASKDDATARYVLLRLAGEQAIAAGDVNQALDVVGKLQAAYSIDGADMKVHVLAAILRAPSVSKENVATAFDTAMTLGEDAMVHDNYDLATRCSVVAAAAGQKSHDIEQNRAVKERNREIDRLKGKFASVQKALDSLKSDPTDAAANLAVGEWCCFVKGNWDKGLPLLAKGNRDDLAGLAKRDLSNPGSPKDQAAVADAWWTLSDKESSALKPGLKGRARHWYEIAAPQLAGLDKARAEKRLEAEAATSGAEPAAAPTRRGIVQKGNVALGTNGTTATANNPWLYPAEALFDGNSTRYDSSSGFTSTAFPSNWVITLNKVYSLQEVRFLLWDLNPKQFYHYRLSTSADGKNYQPLIDHSQGEWKSWQEIKFPTRAVKCIKLECLYSTGTDFAVVEFEAYCSPHGTGPKR